MKRIYVVIAEFSGENNENSLEVTKGLPEVFTTLSNAKKYIDNCANRYQKYMEEEDCMDFAYRLTVHTEADTYLRWSVLGRNMNAIY